MFLVVYNDFRSMKINILKLFDVLWIRNLVNIYVYLLNIILCMYVYVYLLYIIILVNRYEIKEIFRNIIWLMCVMIEMLIVLGR